MVDGTEHIEGHDLTLLYETKKCIHARFCVTGAPKVFLANVKGPWIDPDAIEVDQAWWKSPTPAPQAPSATTARTASTTRHAPPVNLIAIREAGPYAVRGAHRV